MFEILQLKQQNMLWSTLTQLDCTKRMISFLLWEMPKHYIKMHKMPFVDLIFHLRMLMRDRCVFEGLPLFISNYFLLFKRIIIYDWLQIYSYKTVNVNGFH